MAFLTRVLLLCSTLLAAAMPAVGEENVQLIEQKIKAGLIYNFLKYTQWPKSGPTTSVCLYGGDPFDGHIAPMAGRTVNQSTIEIRVVRPAEDVAGCSLLIINAEQKASWLQVKAALTGKDVLTVSDFDGFVDGGGMIEFTREDDRVAVKINMDAVATTRLVVSDRLLKLATVVHGAARER